MKKVDACLTTNPLVVLGGFWEQKRGKMILRCKSGRRPRVKVLAHCIKKGLNLISTESFSFKRSILNSNSKRLDGK